MTLNGIIAIILLYFTEFELEGRNRIRVSLHHCVQQIGCQIDRGTQNFCGSESANGRVRSPHITGLAAESLNCLSPREKKEPSDGLVQI